MTPWLFSVTRWIAKGLTISAGNARPGDGDLVGGLRPQGFTLSDSPQGLKHQDPFGNLGPLLDYFLVQS